LLRFPHKSFFFSRFFTGRNYIGGTYKGERDNGVTTPSGLLVTTPSDKQTITPIAFLFGMLAPRLAIQMWQGDFSRAMVAIRFPLSPASDVATEREALEAPVHRSQGEARSLRGLLQSGDCQTVLPVHPRQDVREDGEISA
jgi:hypothetical protein